MPDLNQRAFYALTAIRKLMPARARPKSRADLNRSVLRIRMVMSRWCRMPDLNQRPTHYECVALPTELMRPLTV